MLTDLYISSTRAHAVGSAAVRSGQARSYTVVFRRLRNHDRSADFGYAVVLKV